MKSKILFIVFLFTCVISFAQLTGKTNALSNSQSNNDYIPAKHFVTDINTGNNMTIGIPEYVWSQTPTVGDELGVFNQSGELVGSGVYNGKNFALAVWGDDETTDKKEGAQSGTPLSFQLWHKENGSIDVLEVENWIEGDGAFKTNGISVVGKFKVKQTLTSSSLFKLGQNVPNPVKNRTEIGFEIPNDCLVKISLFTANGKFVKNIVEKNFTAGEHTIEFFRGDLASGNYYYKLDAMDFSATKNIAIAR